MVPVGLPVGLLKLPVGLLKLKLPVGLLKVGIGREAVGMGMEMGPVGLPVGMGPGRLLATSTGAASIKALAERSAATRRALKPILEYVKIKMQERQWY